MRSIRYLRQSLQLSVLLVMISMLGSCEENLFEEQENLKTIDNSSEVEQLFIGAYNHLLFAHDSRYFYHFQLADDLRQLPSSSNTRSDPEGIVSCNYSGGEIRSFDDLYQTHYKAVVTINKLIHTIPDLNLSSDYLGEAYLLRAFCYFNLVRLFGEIPLVLDLNVNYTLQAASYREVYDQIIADLTQSLALLPEVPGTTRHKLSKGTTKAVMAEVYLNMAGHPLNDTEKYGLAIKYAEEVINNSGGYQFALTGDYANIWQQHTPHQETIFALKLPTYQNRNLTTNELEAIEDHLWGRTTRSGSSVREQIYHRFGPELGFYDRFPDDYRKQVSFTNGYNENFYTSILGEGFSWVRFVPVDPMATDLPECYNRRYIHYTKFIQLPDFEDPELSSRANVIQEIPLFRFAHTLLTYAEAKARSGELDEHAYEALNMVRRRADSMDVFTPSAGDIQMGLSAEAFADSVVQERAWEFSMEPQGRWFDIARLDLRDEVQASRYELELVARNADEIFPNGGYTAVVPQEDRWLNPNLEIDED